MSGSCSVHAAAVHAATEIGWLTWPPMDTSTSRLKMTPVPQQGQAPMPSRPWSTAGQRSAEAWGVRQHCTHL